MTGICNFIITFRYLSVLMQKTKSLSSCDCNMILAWSSINSTFGGAMDIGMQFSSLVKADAKIFPNSCSFAIQPKMFSCLEWYYKIPHFLNLMFIILQIQHKFSLNFNRFIFCQWVFPLHNDRQKTEHSFLYRKIVYFDNNPI